MEAKKAMKTLICILMVVLAVSLTACENDNGADDTTLSAASTAGVVSSSASSVYEAEAKPDIESTEPEQEPTYYHAALCGAVVTEQDGSPRFTYVKKCESCGTVQSGSNTTNATGGVLHGSFLCFECKETQQFEIETTKN